MKRSIFTLLTSLLLMITSQMNLSAATKINVIDTHKIEVTHIILTIQEGDGFFKLARRLFMVMKKDPTAVTWEDVYRLKSFYIEQTGNMNLMAGQKFIVVKSDFIY
ncbi:hypothetical protein [Flammeovirga pacifica]|uniref:LysM domain-containing protein n=1 Tax=Flammeovirga pacifica TaxID=915059 RepID=A0A1S1YT23_FLAPC|nr:hypothetical protein [Flammeovirga pacifica]OHX64184.1 hypothetical protein NH26_21505 [Flammeovirga pacifica]